LLEFQELLMFQKSLKFNQSINQSIDQSTLVYFRNTSSLIYTKKFFLTQKHKPI